MKAKIFPLQPGLVVTRWETLEDNSGFGSWLHWIFSHNLLSGKLYISSLGWLLKTKPLTVPSSDAFRWWHKEMKCNELLNVKNSSSNYRKVFYIFEKLILDFLWSLFSSRPSLPHNHFTIMSQGNIQRKPGRLCLVTEGHRPLGINHFNTSLFACLLAPHTVVCPSIKIQLFSTSLNHLSVSKSSIEGDVKIQYTKSSHQIFRTYMKVCEGFKDLAFTVCIIHYDSDYMGLYYSFWFSFMTTYCKDIKKKDKYWICIFKFHKYG